MRPFFEDVVSGTIIPFSKVIMITKENDKDDSVFKIYLGDGNCIAYMRIGKDQLFNYEQWLIMTYNYDTTLVHKDESYSYNTTRK